jgi:hypothetical protein
MSDPLSVAKDERNLVSRVVEGTTAVKEALGFLGGEIFHTERSETLPDKLGTLDDASEVTNRGVNGDTGFVISQRDILFFTGAVVEHPASLKRFEGLDAHQLESFTD